MSRNRLVPAAIFIPIMIGFIGIYMVSHSSRYELFRTVDILQLVGSGMCFGVALASIVMFAKGGRS